MKGDFSVWRYDPQDNDQGVLYQQGRVTLDRDLTDAERIAMHWRHQAAQDVIGRRVAAVPADEPDGFFVESAAVGGGEVHLRVRPGRVWADGILVYLPPNAAAPGTPVDRVARYLAPPLNPTPLPAIGAGVRDAVVLEVALEELNAFQVPNRLLEPALGGPDTSERVTTRIGFGLVRLGPNEDCTAALARIQDGPAGKGRLSVSLDPPIVVAGECPTVEGGGYTGFEHNLFRIELAATNDGVPRFTWSRFGGGLVGTGVFQAGTPNRVRLEGNRAAILNSGVTEFYLEALRYDQGLGHWAVVYGAPAHLNSAQDLELAAAPVFGTFSFPSTPVFFRLWNGLALVGAFTNAVAPVELVDGIHLAFDPPATSQYREGDYWTFDVRAGEIENEQQLLLAEPPQGVTVHRVPLAEVDWTAAQDTTKGGLVEDCRARFRPLTNQKVCCTLLIGDGVTTFGDFNSLEEAALHLPAAGGELCLLPGVHFANLTLVGKANVRIHGCARRTIVLPRLKAAADPIFTFVDCVGVEVATMDLVSLFGPIVVATGSTFDRLKDVRIEDCRMVARTYAVRVLTGEQVTVARNQIWMLDTAQGKAAIQVRAHRGLVERNVLGVWPVSFTPPGDTTGGGGTPMNPADPCAKPDGLYANVVGLVGYAVYVWTTSIQFAPLQPYLAWGGIHLVGGCEDVRVLENRVDGGAGHGVTLGGLLPGEPGTAVPPDPVAPPTVSLSSAQFDALVRDEAGQPVTGVDVSLTQNGAIRGQGTSAGAQAALGIKVAAGTYGVGVEAGYQIVQIRSVDAAAAPVFLLVVRVVVAQVQPERAFLYDITLRENEILRMALSGIGFLPFTALPPATPPPDLTDPVALAALLATAFAPHLLIGTTNIVRDLTIADNRIHHNLRVVFTPALRAAAREIGQGGISLGLVENGRIVGNRIHDNGMSAVDAVAGIFVGYAENVDITDNDLTGNGAIPENYETAKVDGIRGGIYVRFASALLVGGERDAVQKPAVRIIGNRVDQPAGRAVTVLAFGPVACQGNYLSSERTGRLNVLDTVAGAALILNLGGLNRQQRFTASDLKNATANTAASPAASALAAQLLPSGEVLFNDNQVRLGTEHRSLVATLILGLDDVGFDGNQSNVFRRDQLFASAVTLAFSQRVIGNRFREDTARCIFSLLTFSFGISAEARLLTMNTTAHNQGDHCIYAASNAPQPPDPAPFGPPVVNDGNLEATFDVCQRLLGTRDAANVTIARALVTALFGQQEASPNAGQYGTTATVALADATKSVTLAGYSYRSMYSGEATRLQQELGPNNPRVQTLRAQVQRSGSALQQVEVASEMATITVATAPSGGSVFDGRVVDTAQRGRDALQVELVRANDSTVGVTARTDASGYFAAPLDAAQMKALAGEKALFVRVKDVQGQVVYRDTATVSFTSSAPVRATVVLPRADVSSDALGRSVVVFTRPGTTGTSGTPGRSTPLEAVKGVGPVVAERLRQAGIADVETLLRTPGEVLVKVAGFDADVVRKMALEMLGAEPSPRPTPSQPVPAPTKETSTAPVPAPTKETSTTTAPAKPTSTEPTPPTVRKAPASKTRKKR